MDAYNFRNIDKSIKPINDNITKQLKTGPNVLRMVFSSTDHVNTTTSSTTDPTTGEVTTTVTRINNQPIFNVDPSIFTKFDPNRPVYYFLEYVVNSSSSFPGNPHNLVWLNMPSSNSVWYSNQSNKNILGTFRSNGSSTALSGNLMPYVADVNQLTSMSQYSFAWVYFDHNLLTNGQTNNLIFAITFYQQ